MVELRVRKVGNSLGVVLPKEVVSRHWARRSVQALYARGGFPEGGYQAGEAYDVATSSAKMAKARRHHRAVSQYAARSGPVIWLIW